MIPYIHTAYGNIPTFTVMIVIGVLLFLGITHIELKKGNNNADEENYIFPKIVISGIIAYAFSAIADSLFKLRENGAFVLSGITFYGGLFGGCLGMYIMLRFSKSNTQYTKQEWFELLTLPMIAFHIFGRLGCFLAGCCYGKETDGILGVVFPDNEVSNIFHYGQKCYPTQLFEVFALIIIFFCSAPFRRKIQDVYVFVCNIKIYY